MNYEILAENARFFTISAAILTLAFAFYFYKWMRKQDEGNETMKEIASHVRSGAIAYLKQQYKVIAFFFAGAFIIFAILSYALKVQNPFIPIGFLTAEPFHSYRFLNRRFLLNFVWFLRYENCYLCIS